MSKIINIRGTSGSGKSTLVRHILQCCIVQEAYYEDGRKRPLYYLCTLPNPDMPRVAVIGHYETACGGCDTIPKTEKVFQLARQLADDGNIVIYEGLLLAADVKNIAALHQEGYDVCVIALTDVPLQECLDSVNERRLARNPDADPVNPTNTESKFRGVRRSVERMEDEYAMEVHQCDRDSAELFLTGLLGVR